MPKPGRVYILEKRPGRSAPTHGRPVHDLRGRTTRRDPSVYMCVCATTVTTVLNRHTTRGGGAGVQGGLPLPEQGGLRLAEP